MENDKKEIKYQKKIVNKKIFWILIFICIIILIIGIIILVRKNRFPNTARIGKNILDTKADNVLNLSGFGVFFEQYNGYLSSSGIAHDLEKITIKYLPELCDDVKNYDEEELKNYYQQNYSDIELYLGITDFEKFSEFVNVLLNKNINLNTWDKLDIITSSFLDNSDIYPYAYAEYIVTYINGETIKFSMYFAKYNGTSPVYMIDIK